MNSSSSTLIEGQSSSPSVLVEGLSSLPFILVEGLSYEYDDHQKALEGVTFSVERGERVAILGPNGAGKSTLLDILAGLKRPSQGHTVVRGIRLDTQRRPGYVPGVGVLFQDPDDQIFMPTVEEDVAFGPINLGLEQQEVEMRVEMAMKLTGLEGFRKRVPHHLSFGEKKRVALAGVLAMNPDVLLLDEPTANLDPSGRKELIYFLGTLNCTILVATHDISTALQITDRAVVLDRTVLATGNYTEIFSDTHLMERGKLEIPEIPALFQRLKEEGYWDGDIPLKGEDAQESLRALLEERNHGDAKMDSN